MSPYVPSLKTDGKSDDRVLIDVEVEKTSSTIAGGISINFDVLTILKKEFVTIGLDLRALVEGDAARFLRRDAHKMARVVYEVGLRYGYQGAYLGELNYAITRLIQRVPQVMVATGRWAEKDELRYWLYAVVVEALVYAATKLIGAGVGVGGVFEDVKDEYKRRVNQSYEAAQIVKSGDCYTTPYYSRLVEVVTEEGRHVGHQEVMLKRDPSTLSVDVLPWKIVVRS